MRYPAARRLFVGLLALATAGCSTVVGSALDEAARRTGAGIGRAAGDAAGSAAGSAVASRMPEGAGPGAGGMPRVFTPELSAFYVSYLFSLAFHSGSYTFEQEAYEPGEWTRWRILSDGEATGEMERAFIARTPEGREWWRVKYIDRGEGDPAEIVLEGLFSADKSELLRLRGRMPGDEQANELPVQEGTYGYVEPIRLTEESVAGATVGVERVTVPAGSFEARHVRYGGMGGGTVEWWLSDAVPGGMVRYTSGRGEEGAGVVELIGHGTGAKSELGVQ